MTTLLAGTDHGLLELRRGQPAAGVHLGGNTVDALVADGTGWWAVVEGWEVWRAPADRRYWDLRAIASSPRLTCLVPTPSGLFAGTAEAHLNRLGDDGRLDPVEGFDHVEGRGEWHTPWGGPPDTRSLSWSPDGDGEGTLYAGVHVGGVVLSADGGRSWRPGGLDIHADVHQVLAGTGPGRVLAACARGLAVSDDGGETWRIDDEGLHATYSRAVAATSQTVVLAASSGPDGASSALYRRPLDGDGSFERCREGLPEELGGNVETGCLASAGDTVAFATPSGQAYTSTDHGVTWVRLADGVSQVRCLAVAH
ncbi:MAG: hypothetical protein M3N25_07100 [Actinomycetota bacterium]|nr:hypothetical protein [Actinomycetota bacterium]